MTFSRITESLAIHSLSHHHDDGAGDWQPEATIRSVLAIVAVMPP